MLGMASCASDEPAPIPGGEGATFTVQLSAANDIVGLRYNGSYQDRIYIVISNT